MRANIHIMRGIGITLVVIGHSIPSQISDQNSVYKYFYNLIYSFHIPLFVFISGFCAKEICKLNTFKSKTSFILKKIHRLLVPYFVVSIIGIPFALFLLASNYPSILDKTAFSGLHQIIVNIILYPHANKIPVSTLWFLHCLFMIFIIAVVFSQVKPYYVLTIAFLIRYVSFGAIYLLNFYAIIDLILYFYMGLVLSLYVDTVRLSSMARRLSKYCIPFFALLALSVYFAFPKIICATLGILFTMLLSSWLLNVKFGAIFQLLGKYSYDIYLLSWFFQIPLAKVLFLYYWNLNYNLVVILMCGFGFLPLAVSMFILRKNELTYRLLGNAS